MSKSQKCLSGWVGTLISLVYKMGIFKGRESLCGNVPLSDWGQIFLYLLIVHELTPFLVKWLVSYYRRGNTPAK